MQSRPTKEEIILPKADVNSNNKSRMDGYLHLPANSRLMSRSAAVSQPATQGAIFLDRDGVLVEDVHYLRYPSQLNLLPGVTNALRSLQTHFYLVVATNQSGIARGLFTEEDLLSIHSELVCQLSNEGVFLDALCFCPHLPNAPVPAYDIGCGCRKPSPGMLLKAEKEWSINLGNSYMIGDQPRDIEAGYRAGVSCIMVGEPAEPLFPETQLAPHLAGAADFILAECNTTPQSQKTISVSGQKERRNA